MPHARCASENIIANYCAAAGMPAGTPANLFHAKCLTSDYGDYSSQRLDACKTQYKVNPLCTMADTGILTEFCGSEVNLHQVFDAGCKYSDNTYKGLREQRCAARAEVHADCTDTSILLDYCLLNPFAPGTGCDTYSDNPRLIEARRNLCDMDARGIPRCAGVIREQCMDNPFGPGCEGFTELRKKCMSCG